MPSAQYQPYTRRQTMIAADFELYRYRSTYMNEVALHHHDFYEVYLLLRGQVSYIVENHLYKMRPGISCSSARWSCTRRASPPTPNPTSALCCGWPAATWKACPAQRPA